MNTTTANSGREPVNETFAQDELKEQELKTFFQNNQGQLQTIQKQLSNYKTEDLYCISHNDAQLEATNGAGEQVSLDPQLISLMESYFSAVGTHNDPRVLICDETVRGYSTIDFSFRLPNNLVKGIRYSPEYRDENWEHLGGDWYVYSEGLV
jgi:hypothetical protein